MSSTKNIPDVTAAEARRVVERAAILLRTRPVKGSDPKQAAAWRRSVEEFLESIVLERALSQAGVGAPAGGPAPTQDPAAFLAALGQSLDTDEDNPVAVAVVAVAVVAVVVAGGMIAAYLAGEDAGSAPAPTPVDGGVSG